MPSENMFGELDKAFQVSNPPPIQKARVTIIIESVQDERELRGFILRRLKPALMARAVPVYVRHGKNKLLTSLYLGVSKDIASRSELTE